MLNFLSENFARGRKVFLPRHYLFPPFSLPILEQLGKENSFLTYVFSKKKGYTGNILSPKNLLTFKYVFNKDKEDPLFISFLNSHSSYIELPIFKFLTFRNYPLNENVFRNVLEYTISYDNVKGIVFLLKLAFNQESINQTFLKSVLYDATKIFNYLLDQGIENNGIVIKANPHYSNDVAISNICHYNSDRRMNICNLEMIKKLHSLGTPIDRLEFLYNVSHTIYYPGKFDLIDWLIENGVDIHYDNEALLKEAIKESMIRQVKWLVEHGANIHANNNEPLKMVRERKERLKKGRYEQDKVREYLESLVSKETNIPSAVPPAVSSTVHPAVPTLIDVDISKLRNGSYIVSELKAIARQYKLKVSGTKAELIARIMEYLHLG